MRYTSATKWNDTNADAWLKLGEVAERLKDNAKAKSAYEKIWSQPRTPRTPATFERSYESLNRKEIELFLTPPSHPTPAPRFVSARPFQGA